jgi:hypothetical protein
VFFDLDMSKLYDVSEAESTSIIICNKWKGPTLMGTLELVSIIGLAPSNWPKWTGLFPILQEINFNKSKKVGFYPLLHAMHLKQSQLPEEPYNLKIPKKMDNVQHNSYLIKIRSLPQTLRGSLISFHTTYNNHSILHPHSAQAKWWEFLIMALHFQAVCTFWSTREFLLPKTAISFYLKHQVLFKWLPSASQP